MTYIYDRKAVELDNRLEAVMSTPAEEAPVKTAALPGYLSRPSIAEEIASIPKVATDLSLLRGREKVAEIITERGEALDGIRDALKTAALQYQAELEEQAAVNNHYATLRGAR
jgi:hypothetical protein